MVLLVAVSVSHCFAEQLKIAGIFCGATPNNVLTLRFKFPGAALSGGNATFQMIDFGVERFGLCNEPFLVTPSGELTFPQFISDPANDCMAVQLQLMWITAFTMLPSAVQSGMITAMTMQVGAYSMSLTQQCPV